MPGIDDLINQFFAQEGDITIAPGELVPATSGGNFVEAFIDGYDYFGAIRKEMANLALTPLVLNPYFYFASWYCGLVQGPTGQIKTGQGSSAWAGKAASQPPPAFKLNDGSGMVVPDMIDELETLSSNGTDVRALVWVSPLILERKEAGSQAPEIWRNNLHSLMSVIELRKRKAMRTKVVLSTIAHTLGALHLKMVLAGDDTAMRAYIGGLDFVYNRVSGWRHPAGEGWHDAAARVQGPAAGEIYNYFKLLWDEQLDRPVEEIYVNNVLVKDYEVGTLKVLARNPPAIGAPNTQHVQVLRTAPVMRFAILATPAVPVDCLRRAFGSFGSDKLSFAPDGIFEFRLALRKSISNAVRYIYIEDQGFYSLEIMDWIHDRMMKPEGGDLRVILVHGRDPTDPTNTFMFEAINQHLIHNDPVLSQRVVFYERPDLIVHSKVTIIDDAWAAIGTANAQRRSLYTDIECSIGVLDEATPSFAQQLRKNLWAGHCWDGQPLGPGEHEWDVSHTFPPGAARDIFLDINKCIGIWDPTWGPVPPGAALRSEFNRMKVPFEHSQPANGFVDVTKDSAFVQGHMTSWDVTILNLGIRIDVPDARTYHIKSINSAHQLELTAPYKEDTNTGMTYRLEEPGRWLVENFNFDPVRYDQLDPDSRKEY